MARAFITIDEQGWCFYFHTNHRWAQRPARWLLNMLRRLNCVEVVNKLNLDEIESQVLL